MSSRKEKFKKEFEKAELRHGQLQELGYQEDEMIRTMMGEGFTSPVLSKLFGKSGRQLAEKKMVEDTKLAKKNISERKDAKKPIREKEIEDAAWFHNLLHDVGKHVFTRMVKFVEWGDQDMNDYEKARAKLCNFIDSVQALIEDSGKIQRLEDEKTLLEMNLIKYQHVLAVAVKRVEMLKWYNDMLIGVMTPEVRLRALNQMIAASAIKVIPEGLVQAEMEAPTVD